jgi:hypothetical protein
MTESMYHEIMGHKGYQTEEPKTVKEPKQMMKVEHEIDLQGHEFVRWGLPCKGDLYIEKSNLVQKAGSDFQYTKYHIVRKTGMKEIWVNEYPDGEKSVNHYHHLTEERARFRAGSNAIRTAVRYVEAREEIE